MTKSNRSIKTRKARDDLPKSAEIIWTTVRRGLSLGYRPSAKSWIARAYARGRLLHKRLGEEASIPSYDDAKDLAEAWFRLVRGDAPLGYDVLSAIEDYARTKAASESSRIWQDLRGLAKHLPGELLRREVAELKTDELERWRDGLRVKPATRRRVFTVLAAALTNAHRLHGAGNLNTWRRVKPVKIAKATRARVFIPTDAEVDALLSKCEPDFAALVRAALATACRYGELAGVEVRDFDAERGELSIRSSKTGERTMLLSSAAVRFFAEQTRGKTPRARIFTTAEGEAWRPSMQHRRVRAATPIRAFVFYSLRHVALSKQLSAGIPSAIVARNAGTSEQMLKAHYHKFVPADRALFDRVAA